MTITGGASITFSNLATYLAEYVNNIDTEKTVIIYVAPKETANDSNTGLTADQPVTLQHAFDTLQDFYNKHGILNGTWTIQLAAGTYTGTDTYNTLQNIQSQNPIIIKGPDVAKGVSPTAIFDGENLNTPYAHGMYLSGVSAKVQNIKFVDFNTGTVAAGGTRCGLVFNHCQYAYALNIWADSCDWAGIFAQGIGRFYEEGGHVNACRQGILAQFGVQVSIGYNANDATPDAERTTATNCIEYGIFITDNCTGHIDYTITDTNYVNIGYAYNSSSNLVKNQIKNAVKAGIQAANGGFFYDTTNTFTTNAQDVMFFNNSAPLSYLGKSFAMSDFERESYDYTSVSITTGTATIKSYTIPGKLLSGRGKGIKLENVGEISVVAGTDSAKIALKINGVEKWSYTHSSATSGYKGWYISIQVLNFSSTSQILLVKFISELAVRVAKVSLTDDIANDIVVLLEGTITNNAGIKLYSNECYLIGY